jgi:hypothetical protein
MAEVRVCRRCGAELAGEAPEGVCAACVTPTGDAGQSTGPYAGRANPPPAALAASFPSLEVMGLLGQG